MTSQNELKIAAVIPAYNEEKTIAQVIRGLLPIAGTIIVVDDCSKDDTAKLAASAGALVIRHQANKGYDGSIGDGFAEAAHQGADIVITCDADGQHRPADVRAVFAPVAAGTADVAVGQRTKLGRFGERIFAAYSGWKFGVSDPLCGLKVYRRSVYEASGHFDTLNSIGTQLMAEAWLNGFRIAKVPVVILPRSDASRFYSRELRANLKILAAAYKIISLTLWKKPKS